MSKKLITNINCMNCSSRSFCLPVSLMKEELEQLDQITQQYEIKRKEHLFQINNSFKYLYAIRNGTFKSYIINTEGDEQIYGFNFTGELLGFDGKHSGKYCRSLQALEDSEVCEISFDKLLVLSSKLPKLRDQLFNILSKKYSLQLQPGINSTAEMRFSIFLFDLSNRMRERGLSPINFKLVMSRQDIANYLGLTIETISRLIRIFENRKIIIAQGRKIQLLDLNKLQKMSCRY